MEKIYQGAEAVLYKDGNTVVKERVSKRYRIPEFDEALRKARTRREAKILEKLKTAGIPAPKLLAMDDKAGRLSMSFVNGIRLREVFDGNPLVYAKEIGRTVGLLHNNDIIHSDLTTSNMILAGNKLNLLDFGLSFFSTKAEDKAVDLHLLDRAIYSRHPEAYEAAIKAAFDGYAETARQHEEVLKRLEVVQKRGRNKKK